MGSDSPPYATVDKVRDMRVIVCGGRDYADRDKVRFVLAVWPVHDLHLDKGHVGIRWDLRDAAEAGTLTIVHGEARGADRLADDVARDLGYRVESYRADWSQGRAAGPIRNKQMLAEGADLVVAFPGGKGTAHMVRIAREAGVPVLEVAA